MSPLPKMSVRGRSTYLRHTSVAIGHVGGTHLGGDGLELHARALYPFAHVRVCLGRFGGGGGGGGLTGGLCRAQVMAKTSPERKGAHLAHIAATLAMGGAKTAEAMLPLLLLTAAALFPTSARSAFTLHGPDDAALETCPSAWSPRLAARPTFAPVSGRIIWLRNMCESVDLANVAVYYSDSCDDAVPLLNLIAAGFTGAAVQLYEPFENCDPFDRPVRFAFDPTPAQAKLAGFVRVPGSSALRTMLALDSAADNLTAYVEYAPRRLPASLRFSAVPVVLLHQLRAFRVLPGPSQRARAVADPLQEARAVRARRLRHADGLLLFRFGCVGSALHRVSLRDFP